MILKFDEIVFTELYELRVTGADGKLMTMDVPVSISDDEAREIGEALQGNSERIEQILFTDLLDQIKTLLIGPNYAGFYLKVLGDLANFTQLAVEETITTAKTEITQLNSIATEEKNINLMTLIKRLKRFFVR